MNGVEWLNRIVASIGGSLRSARGESSFPTVLIVGEPDTATLASSPDWHLLTTSSLAEAQTLLQENVVAMAVCDKDIPGMDWEHTVPELAGRPSRPCVLLLTNSEDYQLWERVIAAGGYDVLRKPVTAETLSRSIRAGISHWRSARALEATLEQGLVRK